MLEQTDEATVLMPVGTRFPKAVKRRKKLKISKCMAILSFLKGELISLDSVLVCPNVHVAFWAIKQSLAFALPLNTSNVFSCMAFFKLQLTTPAVFLNFLWTHSNAVSSTMAFQSLSFRDAALFHLFPLPPAPNLPRPLPFVGIFSEGR